MNVIKFERNECVRVRPLLDAYVSNELSVEATQTVLSHVESCMDCASRLDSLQRVRAALRAAGRGVVAPDALREEIRAALRHDGGAPRSWRLQQTWIAVAAGLLVVAGAVFSLRLWSPSATPATAVAPGVMPEAAALRIGYDDHMHCAVLRILRTAAPSDDEIFSELGSHYDGLYRVVAGRVPFGFNLVDAHRCRFAGRQFVHMIYRHEDTLLSIVATPRDDDWLDPRDALDVVQASGVDVHRSRVDNVHVDGFQAGQHLVFVVSGLPADENFRVVAALARPIAQYLGAMPA